MTATPRPVQHLIAAGKQWPNAWQLIDRMRADRGKDPLPDWPEWCFLPMAGAYAVVSGGMELSLEEAGGISRLAALAAWRPTQGIYRFHPDVFGAVWDTPIDGELPIEVLYRLPEWCVYVETPGKTYLGDPLHGFFAHLEYDINHHTSELRLLLDTDRALIPTPLHLVPGGLEQSVQRFIDRAAAELLSRGHMPPEGTADDRVIRDIADSIAPCVSLVLYLCSAAAELRTAKGPDAPTRPSPTKTKRGPRLFPPQDATVWETGFRTGEALRKASSQSSSGEGGTVRPHIRRAHWHTYWLGPRSDPQRRTAELRWLPPIPVNLDTSDDVKPTIRRVK